MAGRQGIVEKNTALRVWLEGSLTKEKGEVGQRLGAGLS
jgi:hypothetical protein